MNTDQIKQKLAKYLTDFQLEEHGFKKFLIVKNYINYLESIKSLKKIIVDEQAPLKNFFLEMSKKEPKGEEAKKEAIGLLQKLDFAKPNYLKPKPSFENVIEKPNAFISNYYNILKSFVSLLDAYKLMPEEKQLKTKRAIEVITKDFYGMTGYISAFACLNYAIIDYLSTEEFLKEEKQNQKAQISFNPQTSALNFKGEEIKIARKNDLTKDHYILEALFEQEDLKDEVYYKDIAEKKLFEDYNSEIDFNKYYKACQRLQEKIRTSTKKKIDDFLIFHTGKKGHVKLNPEYIKSCLKNEPLNHDE